MVFFPDLYARVKAFYRVERLTWESHNRLVVVRTAIRTHRTHQTGLWLRADYCFARDSVRIGYSS